MMKHTLIRTTTLGLKHDNYSMNRNDIAPVYIPIAGLRWLFGSLTN